MQRKARSQIETKHEHLGEESNEVYREISHILANLETDFMNWMKRMKRIIINSLFLVAPQLVDFNVSVSRGFFLHN